MTARGITAADIWRDIQIADSLDIDPAYINWIGKAIRRDPRYNWNKQQLADLGVIGLDWDTVTDEQVKELALRLRDRNKP